METLETEKLLGQTRKRSNSRKRHQRHRSESYDEHREAEEGSFRLGNNASKGVINGNESDAWHQLIPFGNSHYLARLRQNSDYVCIGFEVFGVILCLIAMYFCYFHFDEFHFTVAHAYAKLGNQHAQHIVGERLLHGKGVDMNKELAMAWFRKAAEQGHPHSAYNLAVGHFTGIKTDIQPGEAHQLIRHAAENGVVHAVDVLENFCKHGKCD